MNFKGNCSKHPLYGVWNDMKRRCYDKKRPEYKNYGGRGIRVAKEWLADFWQFVSDIGDRPEGHTLDRIDNEKNYNEQNCKWSTAKEQANNKRSKYTNTKHKYIYKTAGKYQVIICKPKRKYIGTYKTLKQARMVAYQFYT